MEEIKEGRREGREGVKEGSHSIDMNFLPPSPPRKENERRKAGKKEGRKGERKEKEGGKEGGMYPQLVLKEEKE